MREHLVHDTVHDSFCFKNVSYIFFGNIKMKYNMKNIIFQGNEGIQV
jgi:hypothetical protein